MKGWGKPNKATFETTLWHQNNYPWSSAENEYYTISNMPPKKVEQVENGWRKTDFKTTKIISTTIIPDSDRKLPVYNHGAKL